MEPSSFTTALLVCLALAAGAFAAALYAVSSNLDALWRHVLESRPPVRPRGLPRACPLLRVVRADGRTYTVTITREPGAPKSEVA